jgi:hypothetical protein
VNTWVYYNPSPAGRNVGDCAVRAVAKALDVDWETAFAMITANAFQMSDMPSSNAAWGSVLRQHGFMRSSLPPTCPDCYTAEDFAKDHPRGIYVLGFGNHTATVKNGRLFDSYDSSQMVPQYFWEKVS